MFKQTTCRTSDVCVLYSGYRSSARSSNGSARVSCPILADSSYFAGQLADNRYRVSCRLDVAADHAIENIPTRDIEALIGNFVHFESDSGPGAGASTN